MERKLELLAPAGSFESLKAAVKAGADAVYMGGNRFGARAYADNPEGDSLLEAIDYTHLYGGKLYLTINTLLKERELERELYDFLLPCYEHGLDAVIVQDLGVLQAVREWFPDLTIHASTQMTLCGSKGVEMLKEAGANRVVLARELSLAEITRIYEDTKMEIECFVHGALCYCYSGQCLFSSILGGRSGNRGRCAQPCRLSYEALEGKVLVSREGGQTLLSPKDICTLELLPKIARAGVHSLKIEGRMKRPEYTAGVVRIYRKYADHYLKYGEKDYHVWKEELEELRKLFNRDGFSRGYYEQHNGKEMMALSGKKPDRNEKKAYEELLSRLRQEYVETEKKLAVAGKLYAEAGQPMKLEILPVSEEAPDGKFGEDFRTLVTGSGLTVYGACPQIPKNRPMEKEQIEKQLKKTGTTPFEWSSLEIHMEGALFLPVQALNCIRREALEKLQETIIRSRWRVRPEAAEQEQTRDKSQAEADNRESGKKPEELSILPDRKSPGLHISVETKEQLEAVLSMADHMKENSGCPLRAVYVDADSMEEELTGAIAAIHRKGLSAYVMLPPVFRMNTCDRYRNRKGDWAGLPAEGYVFRNLEEYGFLREIGWMGEMVPDHNVYMFNRRCRRFWKEQGIGVQTNPLELNSRELREISSEESIQIIYGRYPMMVTAGCLHKTLDRCRKKSGMWTLKDRYQKEFPVKNHCKNCYNIIYNSQPLYLMDLQEELKQIEARAWRIMFTVEKTGEVTEVLSAFLEGRKAKMDFTRGHFKRGIE